MRGTPPPPHTPHPTPPRGIYTLHFSHAQQHRCVQAWVRINLYSKPDTVFWSRNWLNVIYKHTFSQLHAGLRVICHHLKQNEAQNACPNQQTRDTLASERRHTNTVTTTMISTSRRAAVWVELFVIIVTDVVISPHRCFKFKFLKVLLYKYVLLLLLLLLLLLPWLFFLHCCQSTVS